MAPNVPLPQLFLPLSSVKLGRLVFSLDNPNHDFHDPLNTSNPEVGEKVQSQYSGIYNTVQQRDASSQLTSLLSSSFSKRLKASVQITAAQSKTYYLNNSGQWFRDAVQNTDTQRWIERSIDEGEDIYIIVAYHTLLDARIREISGDQSAAGGSLVAPLSAALTASGICVPFNTADPGISGFYGRRESEQEQFTSLDEQVHAVQYRKVRWNWFSSKKVNEMTLAKKAWWERYDRLRNVEAEIEDLIEVDLEDALEGDCDEFTMEYGDILNQTM